MTVAQPTIHAAYYPTLLHSTDTTTIDSASKLSPHISSYSLLYPIFLLSTAQPHSNGETMTSYPNATQSTALWHQHHHQEIPSTHSQLTTPILVHYAKTAISNEPLPLTHYGPPVHTTNSPTSTQSSPTPAAPTVQYKQYGVVHRTQLPHLVTVSPHIQNTSIPNDDFVPVHSIVEHC